MKILADDGETYLVKGRHNGRMIVNEQIVGLLGAALGAPVAPVVLVDVPAALINAEPNMRDLQPGVSHGSAWRENCTDRQGIAYTGVAENRARFAGLAVLYSWVRAGDQQWIYEKAAPNLVHSVDHGHFFPNGPDWTVAALKAAGDPVLDTSFQACGLNNADLSPAIHRLDDIEPADIAKAVARPWHDWNISDDERIEMALYLDERRTKLVQLMTGTGP